MLLKCCTQYVSKFGKLSRGHETGKGQFSFQSHMLANLGNSAVTAGLKKISLHSNPKEKQCQRMFKTTTQSHSSHTLTKLCSKFSNTGFNSTRTENFQTFKLDLEKAEDNICCQHLLDHIRSKRVQEK